MYVTRCPHCGAKLPRVPDDFCETCGEALDEPPQVPRTREEQNAFRARVEREDKQLLLADRVIHRVAIFLTVSAVLGIGCLAIGNLNDVSWAPTVGNVLLCIAALPGLLVLAVSFVAAGFRSITQTSPEESPSGEDEDGDP